MIVIPVRKGGLGNQMFQVAAGLIYAKETGRELVLPNEDYNTHTTTKEYADTIFSFCKYRYHKALTAIEINRLKTYHGFYVYPEKPGFEPWSTLITSGNVILEGYFQYYPPIERHEDWIRGLYLQSLGSTGDPGLIGIHVRRGDYLQFPDVFYSQHENYYRSSIHTMNQLKPGCRYILFSDDIEWCKQQPFFRDLTFCEEKDELITLALMARCHGGFICANSSFSWWGAFLGAHSVRSPCIVPYQWMKDKDTTTLFPSSWIREKITVVDPDALETKKLLQPSKAVTIYVDNTRYIEDSTLKIFLDLEPLAIMNNQEFILTNYSKYTSILTFDDVLLKACPNAIKCHAYTITWLDKKDYEAVDITKKRFEISSLIGFKKIAVGHDFRLIIYANQVGLNQYLPLTCYRSCKGPLLPELLNNPLIGPELKDKIDLFTTYQFSIVIENSRQKDYYTEKLVDCLLTKTIPIYYGCPNIQDHFDTTGWIILDSEDLNDLLRKCSVLTPNYYSQFYLVIQKNYEKCLPNLDFYENINRVLRMIPGYL